MPLGEDEGCGSGESNLSGRWRTSPRRVPRPSPYSWGTREPGGPAGTRVLQRPSVAAPQSPPLPARPQTAFPAAQETRHAQSFRARRLEKGRGQVPEPRSTGVAGAVPRLAAMARGLSPNGLPRSPRIPRCPQAGPGPSKSRGRRTAPLPQPSSGGREGNPGPRRERDAHPPGLRYQGVLGALGFAFFIFLIGGRGRPTPFGAFRSSAIRILDAPKEPHLQSTAPPNVTLLAGVTSGSSNSPPLPPPPASRFGRQCSTRVFPAVRSGPAGERRWRGSGASEPGTWSWRGPARRGAYLVHGEWHADPVLLQQHGPAGHGPPRREAGGAGVGAPPDQQGCRPGAELSAGSPVLGAGRRSSPPGGALSSWLPPLRPRACQGLGPGVRCSPASFLAEVDPPGTRCCKVREGGRPTGNQSDRQPGAAGAEARSGHARRRAREGKKKKTKPTRFPKITRNTQKSPSRSASETRS